MKLLIASNNKHKIREISDVLKGKFDIVSLDEENIVCDPEENGETFLQNATIKANAVAKHTALAVLADDTGLCVDALGGTSRHSLRTFCRRPRQRTKQKKTVANDDGNNQPQSALHMRCGVALPRRKNNTCRGTC